MITKFDTYLLEKSSFSDILPNELVSYVHSRFIVSKNKFTYSEISKEELYNHYDTTAFICDNWTLLIIKISYSNSLIIGLYTDGEKHSEYTFVNNAHNNILQQIYTDKYVGKSYKIDVEIKIKKDTSEENKNYNYIDTYLSNRIRENLIKILPRFKNKYISELKSEIIKYANDIDDSIIISNYLVTLSNDLKRVTLFNMDSFLKNVSNHRITEEVRNILADCYKLYTYDKNFMRTLKPIEETVITLTIRRFIKIYLLLEINHIKRIDNELSSRPDKFEKYRTEIINNPDLNKKYKHLLDANNFDLI